MMSVCLKKSLPFVAGSEKEKIVSVTIVPVNLWTLNIQIKTRTVISRTFSVNSKGDRTKGRD